MSHIIVDNFLNRFDQKKIESLVLKNSNIDWKYIPYSTYDNIDLIKEFTIQDPNIYVDSSFTHTIFLDISHINPEIVKSPIYNDFKNIPELIERKFNLKINKLLRMRISFTMPNNFDQSKYGLPHVDSLRYYNGKTVLYYINDTSGDTILFKELFNNTIDTSKKTISDRISPKMGRAVMFDSCRYHSASKSTSTPRAVLNINFV